MCLYLFLKHTHNFAAIETFILIDLFILFTLINDQIEGNENVNDNIKYDLPPFKWNVSVEDIERTTEEVLDAATKNLDRIAHQNNSSLTYDNTIRPLKLAPNYKTNHLVCQSKFLQHASPDSEIRAASEEAGKKFGNSPSTLYR